MNTDKNLVVTALAVTNETIGKPQKSATIALAEAINRDLGTRYTLDYVSKWRRGERPVPQRVQDWMRRACLGHAIATCGGQPPPNSELLDRLAEMIRPPERQTKPNC